jgi:hypothetical protein
MAASGAKRPFILKPESLHRDILNAPVAGRRGHPAGTLSSEKMIWLSLWSSRPSQRASQSRHHPRRLLKTLFEQGGLRRARSSEITVTCQRFIDEVLKPRFLPTIRPTQFNYPIDILGKWHGKSEIAGSLRRIFEIFPFSGDSDRRPGFDRDCVAGDAVIDGDGRRSH